MQTTVLANIARHITLTPDEEAAFTTWLEPRHVARFEPILPAGPLTR